MDASVINMRSFHSGYTPNNLCSQFINCWCGQWHQRQVHVNNCLSTNILTRGLNIMIFLFCFLQDGYFLGSILLPISLTFSYFIFSFIYFIYQKDWQIFSVEFRSLTLACCWMMKRLIILRRMQLIKANQDILSKEIMCLVKYQVDIIYFKPWQIGKEMKSWFSKLKRTFFIWHSPEHEIYFISSSCLAIICLAINWRPFLSRCYIGPWFCSIR